VLSQAPDRWADLARGWIARSEPHCTEVDGSLAPDRQERYFILQTLVGVWPIEPERLDGYLEKALREAKRHTNWVDQNEPYERAVKRYAREFAADPGFRAELEQFLDEIASRALRTTLGQLVLKLTAPGVPDTYQGDELEFRALVDPDNRRPVDWELRHERLDHLLGGGLSGESLGDRKLWITARLLAVRNRRPDIFGLPYAEGAYAPLESGPSACAFLRADQLLTVVALPRAGEDHEPVIDGIPPGTWRDVLSGEERNIEGNPRLSELIDAATGIGVYERLGDPAA
jgi:(1->4)-alpha-D-glucan 1-alpha-D-glucosylmutase